MLKACIHTLLVLVSIAALLPAGGCRRLPAATISATESASSAELPSPDATHATPVTGGEVSATLPSSLTEAVAGLDGLPIDRFFEESFKLILLRDPESITSEGLADTLGVRNDRLTDISSAAYQENLALYRAIYDLLLQYDRFSLSPEQQVSYDVYAWYLDDLLRMGAYPYADYPVNPLVVTGVQNLLEYLFVEYHPIRNIDDARDYITRLSLVGEKMDQLVEALHLRQEQGYLPPAILIQASLGDVRGMASSLPERTSYYTAFAEKLDQVPGLSPEEKSKLLDDAEIAIETDVIPAYKALSAALEELPLSNDPAGGVWRLPDGEAYYQAALHHHTSTDLTPQQVHQLGIEALQAIQSEMRQRFTALGYPQDESFSRLYQRLAGDSGAVKGDQILQQYDTLIRQASHHLDDVFAELPQAALEVQGYPGSTAFYTSPALDGSRPGVFYAPLQGAEPRFKMPTLAYHEGMPGHHFQISLARQLDLPLFRNVLTFNAYAEGWALYAERLAWELGWYEGDPYADLGRLQMEAFRAARLVVDTGLHADQWTFDEAVEYMVENTGLEEGFIQSEVVRYLAWPGQAASYSLGYFRLLELRQKAMDGLGERFDLKEFHMAVLQNGSLPLPVLERVVDEYITLASLEKVTDFPLYVMRYQGDYGFSEFIDSASAQHSLELHLPAEQEEPWACTGFAALSPQGDKVFGRNFDWQRHPALLLFTQPSDGFASVSMVDISYLGYTQHQTEWQNRRDLLEAPYWPFDGMNSAGLAVGMMAVPEADSASDPAKPTLNELQVMRLLLDRAANVTEALDLLAGVNIDFGDAVPLHYFIADSSGKSAVVEFVGGEMRILPNAVPWQVSTNFLISEEQPRGANSSCWRYNLAYQVLQQAGGSLSDEAAMTLLKDVSQGGDYPTIWSVVYNLSARAIHLAAGGDYAQVYDFTLEPAP